jgi:hypothetical protein
VEVVFASDADVTGEAFGGVTAFDGPIYGPLTRAWSGSDALSGQLIAFGAFGDGSDGGTAAWFAN